MGTPISMETLNAKLAVTREKGRDEKFLRKFVVGGDAFTVLTNHEPYRTRANSADDRDKVLASIKSAMYNNIKKLEELSPLTVFNTEYNVNLGIVKMEDEDDVTQLVLVNKELFALETEDEDESE